MINMLHKSIKGYEDYLVTDDGRVYSLKTGKYLKPSLQNNGYYNITLSKGNKPKTFKLHRLVAEAFIPNPNNLPQVDHKNHVRDDNRVENLRWCSNSENCKNRNHYQINRKAKGTPIVEKINDEVSIGYLSVRSVPIIGKTSLHNHTRKKPITFLL